MVTHDEQIAKVSDVNITLSRGGFTVKNAYQQDKGSGMSRSPSLL